MRSAFIFFACFALISASAIEAFADSVSPAVAQGADVMRGGPCLTQRNRTSDDNPKWFYGDERSMLEAGYCDIAGRQLNMLGSVAEATPFHLRGEILRVEAVRPAPVEDVLTAFADKTGDAAPVLIYPRLQN